MPTNGLNDLHDQFLKKIDRQLFPQPNSSDSQKQCFWVRFHPENIEKNSTEIWNQIKVSLNEGFSREALEPTIREVVKKIKETFSNQLDADGVELPQLPKGRPSRNTESPWKLLYDWLWGREFPRCGWKLAMEIATYADRGLQMQQVQSYRDDDRDLDLSDIPEPEDNQIKVGVDYRLTLDSPILQPGYLLLIDRGTSGKKLGICPSRAFAPDDHIEDRKKVEIPCDRSLAKRLKYTEVGEEYFLAIVTPEPLNLSWVRPDSPSRDLEIDESRLTEIFQKLSRQSSSQVFYKTFRVID